jgi:hypothetical protein
MTKDQIRAIFLKNGFTVKDGQTDLKDYVYAAAKELINAARLSDARDASRYRHVRRGKALTVRVPVNDKHVTYCLTDKPEAGYPEAFDTAVDEQMTKLGLRWTDEQAKAFFGFGPIDHDLKGTPIYDPTAVRIMNAPLPVFKE